MFPNIVVLPVCLIDIVSLETRVRKILLVFAPTNSLRFQQVNYGLFPRVNAVERVEKNPMRLATNRANIVRLTGMRKTVVVSERNALFRKGV